jgi:hypothetical protein
VRVHDEGARQLAGDLAPHEPGGGQHLDAGDGQHGAAVAPDRAATNDGAQQLDGDLALEELDQQRALLAPLRAAATRP